MHSISSARRKKLRVLQEREAAKARMSRLQTMLQHKLIYKYGSKRNPSCQLNTEIENEVKNFTNKSSHQPTDEEFLELESTIREIRANYCKDGSGFVAGTEDGRASAGPSSGRNGDTTGSSRVQENEGGAGEGRGSSPGQGLPPSIARAWRTFDVAKQIEYETKEKDKAEKNRLQKIRFREELEVYRAHQAKKKAEEGEERRRHMEEQETKLAEFRMEQEAIKKRAADRHAKENGLREEQIKRLQAEKEIERKSGLEREMQDIELCKAQLQGEIDETERKRRVEKERVAFIQAENTKQREYRAQMQRKSNAADVELLKEHRRRMDVEERKRADKLKERMKRYEEIGNFWNERGMGKTKESTNEREERQSVEAARRKEEAELERERKEGEVKRLASIVMATENKKVIQQKNALNEKKQKEDMDFAQRFIKDSEAFMQEERDKKTAKRAAMARYRKELEKQVEETKARRKYEDMSDTEFRLNSDLVKRLEADKQLVAKVRERMENTN